MENNWGFIIKRLRLEKGITQDELASLAGLSRSYITRLEKGEFKRFNLQYFNRMVRALDKNPDDVLKEVYQTSNKGNLGNTYIDPGDNLEVIRVPVRGAVPAGMPCSEEERVEEYELVPRNWLKGVKKLDDVYALHVTGNSLIGDDIQDGDILLVNRSAPFVNGGIYIVRLENECVARHVYQENGKLRLIASNGRYKDIEASEVELLGKVFKSFKPPKEH